MPGVGGEEEDLPATLYVRVAGTRSTRGAAAPSMLTLAVDLQASVGELRAAVAELADMPYDACKITAFGEEFTQESDNLSLQAIPLVDGDTVNVVRRRAAKLIHRPLRIGNPKRPPPSAARNAGPVLSAPPPPLLGPLKRSGMATVGADEEDSDVDHAVRRVALPKSRLKKNRPSPHTGSSSSSTTFMTAVPAEEQHLEPPAPPLTQWSPVSPRKSPIPMSPPAALETPQKEKEPEEDTAVEAEEGNEEKKETEEEKGGEVEEEEEEEKEDEGKEEPPEQHVPSIETCPALDLILDKLNMPGDLASVLRLSAASSTLWRAVFEHPRLWRAGAWGISAAAAPFLTDRALFAIADHAVHLQALPLRGCVRLSIKGVLRVLKLLHKRDKQITLVDFSQCPDLEVVTDSISEYCTSLTTLILPRASIHQRALVGSVKHNAHLVHMVAPTSNVTDKLLQAIGRYLRGIKVLHLGQPGGSAAMSITDGGVERLISSCSHITDLRLNNASKLGGMALNAVILGLRSLSILHLTGTGPLFLVDQLTVQAHGMQHLVELELHYCPVTAKMMAKLAPLTTSLRRLSITNASDLSLQCTEFMHMWGNLEQLMLSNVALSNDDVRAVAGGCVDLQKLYLGGNRVGMAPLMDVVAACGKLQDVTLAEMQVGLPLVRTMALHTPRLAKLTLVACVLAVEGGKGDDVKHAQAKKKVEWEDENGQGDEAPQQNGGEEGKQQQSGSAPLLSHLLELRLVACVGWLPEHIMAVLALAPNLERLEVSFPVAAESPVKQAAKGKTRKENEKKEKESDDHAKGHAKEHAKAPSASTSMDEALIRDHCPNLKTVLIHAAHLAPDSPGRSPHVVPM